MGELLLSGDLTTSGASAETRATGGTRQHGQYGGVIRTYLSGGSHAPGLTSSGSRATGGESPIVSGRAALRKEERPLERKRAARDALLAIERSKSLLESAAESEDIVDRMNRIYEAREALQRVWELSQGREDEFREVVNVVQILLLDKNPETYSPGQILAIKEAVDCLGNGREVADSVVVEVWENLEAEGLPILDILE